MYLSLSVTCPKLHKDTRYSKKDRLMKKISLCILAGILFLYAIQLSSKERHSQTFMATRPINQNIAANQAGWHNIIYNKSGRYASSMQLYGIYQASVKNKPVARYFLPFRCKNELLVMGDSVTDAEARDIRAEWLSIDNHAFQGRLSISPDQRQAGIFFEYNQDISAFTDCSFLQDSWISINAPVVVVENNIGITQYDLVNASATLQKQQDIIQALYRKELKFSRIDPHKRSNVGLAEINIKFGRAYLACSNFEVIYYSGLRIPGSSAQNADFLFDPYVGNNKHIGFQTGVNFQINLTYDCEPVNYCFFASLESTFFLRNKQLRTFDIKKKPWSRYLLLNKKDGPPDQNIPATRILTLTSRVKPYNTVELSTGWRIKAACVEAEIGYDLWAHGDERVKPECHFEEVYGIAGVGPNAQGTARSASKSTISNLAENDTLTQTVCVNGQMQCAVVDHFVVICKSDLDRKSAAARAAINHKFHAACTYLHHGTTVDGFFTIGGLYEYPQKNTALELWAVWLKSGISF